MIRGIELSIIECLKDEDISAAKKIISKNYGIFETYMEYSPVRSSIRVFPEGHDEPRRHMIENLVYALTEALHNNELIIHDFMKFLNRYVRATPKAMNTLLYIVSGMIVVHVRDKNKYRSYLQCVSLMFQYMKNIFTKDFIQEIFRVLILPKIKDASANVLGIMFDLDLEIMDVFLPHIDIHAPIELSRLSDTRIIAALQLRPLEVEYHRLSLVNILLELNRCDILLHLKKSGHCLEDRLGEISFSWSCLKKNFNTELYEDDFTNLKNIVSYMDVFSCDEKWIKQRERTLSKINWDVRLEYNVSPLVMCTSLESANFLLRSGVNRDNYNGLFYVFLHDDEELFMHMMRNGVDPVQSLHRFKKILQNNEICEELKLTYDLFIRCYNNYKIELVKMLSNNRLVCNDVLKMIVNTYL